MTAGGEGQPCSARANTRIHDHDVNGAVGKVSPGSLEGEGSLDESSRLHLMRYVYTGGAWNPAEDHTFHHRNVGVSAAEVGR